MTDNIRHFLEGEIVGDKDLTIDSLGEYIDFSTKYLPTCYYNCVISLINYTTPTEEQNKISVVGSSIRLLNVFRKEYIGFKKSDFKKPFDSTYLALNSVCYNLFATKIDENKWAISYGEFCIDDNQFVVQPMYRHIHISPELLHSSLAKPLHYPAPKWPKEEVLTVDIKRNPE